MSKTKARNKIEISLKELKKSFKFLGKGGNDTELVLKFKDNTIEVISSDLERFIKYKFNNNSSVNDIEVKVDHCLSSVIDKLSSDKDDNIFFEFHEDNKEKLTISKGRMRSNITINNDVKYLNQPEGDFLFSINRNKLIDIFSRTVTAVTKSVAIPDSMKSLCLNFKDGDGMALAVDVRRMYSYKFETDNSELNKRFIIPSKNILEIIRVLSLLDEEKCNIYDCNGMVRFECKDIEICSNVYDPEKYPNLDTFNRLVEFINEDITFTIDGSLLKKSLQPILAFSSSNILMGINNNELNLKATSDRGDFEDTLDIESNISRSICVDSSVLLDTVSHLSNGNINFIFDTDESKPIKLYNDKKDVLIVIMLSQK